MTKSLTRVETAAFLSAHDNYVILTHIRPDGDTLGSASALCLGLRSLGKTAHVLVNTGVGGRFRWMLESLTVEEAGKDDTVISTDVASPGMLPDNAQGYLGRVRLRIDHHGSATSFSDLELVDPDSASCAEVVYDVLELMEAPRQAEVLDRIYVGLSTDTGCFRFANTTARSHITAAWLMEAGARASELNARLFESKKPQRVEAERLALNNLEYYFDGRCALIYLTREDILSSGVAPSDLENLTSLPRAIEGVEVGLTLRQQPGGSYKISVRTTDEVDACAIAKRLGGGGHVRAAGCELMGNLDNAKAAVLAEVKKELARCEQKE